MRKFLIIALILGFVLSGCTTPDPAHDTTNTLDSHLSEPYEDWSSQTDPTDDLEVIVQFGLSPNPYWIRLRKHFQRRASLLLANNVYSKAAANSAAA